ncbi:MAG: signal peptidase I [Bacteroidota bacterium]
MSFIYFYLYILVHPYLAMWNKSFELAGRKSWEALIPGYNYFVAFQVFCDRRFWSLLLLFPGVHLVMLASLNVSYIRRFGYYSFADTLQGILFPYLIFYKIAQSKIEILPATNWSFAKDTEIRKWGDHIVLFLCLPVIGHALALGLGMFSRDKPGAKSRVKEWGDSLLFALVAASIVRTYVFEPFQIPTGSMEKTLLVGDFLFVNKLAYGPKVPVTPLSYPLVHNTVPWVNVRSYTSLEKGSYFRLPGFSKVNRNDVVVFNYPSGDTAVYDPRVPFGLMGHDYHGIVINEARRLFTDQLESEIQAMKYRITDSLQAKGMAIDMAQIENYSRFQVFNLKAQSFIDDLEKWKNKARKMLAVEKIAMDNSTGEIISHFGVISRPVDKRENYIKRCVAVPGDFIEIKKSVLYINDKPAKVHEFQNLRYDVTNIMLPSEESMRERFGLEQSRDDYAPFGDGYKMNLTKSQLSQLKTAYPQAAFVLEIDPQYSDSANYQVTAMQRIENLSMFPKDLDVNNTYTDYSRIQIPSKGQTISITKDNIAWYRRIITAYEGHQLAEKKDGIYIDGKKVSKYTFGMNYYWLMGDNRYNSADSRVWGFVPEDHVVGKASLVWFSKSADPNIGIRWERLFKFIK